MLLFFTTLSARFGKKTIILHSFTISQLFELSPSKLPSFTLYQSFTTLICSPLFRPSYSTHTHSFLYYLFLNFLTMLCHFLATLFSILNYSSFLTLSSLFYQTLSHNSPPFHYSFPTFHCFRSKQKVSQLFFKNL